MTMHENQNDTAAKDPVFIEDLKEALKDGLRSNEIIVIGGPTRRTVVLRALDDIRQPPVLSRTPHLERGGFNRWPGKKRRS